MTMQTKLNQIEIDRNIFTVDVYPTEISADKKEIGYLIGYPNGDLPSHIEEIVYEICEEIQNKLIISSGYRVVNVQYSPSESSVLVIGNIKLHTDRIITSQLKKSEKAAIFLCTIGNQMEKWGKQLLADGDSIKSYLVDVIASVLVESIADKLHAHIGNEYRKLGLNKTNRYSPGYCNWSVAEQQKIFSFFPENFCNVKLTDSSLMIPIKSISGIIGLGSKVKYAEYLCDRCEFKNCTHRIYIRSRQKINN